MDWNEVEEVTSSRSVSFNHESGRFEFAGHLPLCSRGAYLSIYWNKNQQYDDIMTDIYQGMCMCVHITGTLLLRMAYVYMFVYLHSSWVCHWCIAREWWNRHFRGIGWTVQLPWVLTWIYDLTQQTIPMIFLWFSVQY